MWQRVLIICWWLLCSLLPISAQFIAWETFIEQLFQEIELGGEGTWAENLYDDYVDLHAHPININSADSTELQRLGFLTNKQIEGIHYYLYRYGALHSVGELMLIPELDYRTRQLLSYFITFGELKSQREETHDVWRHMLTQGRSELSSRIDIPLYSRAGHATHTQAALDAAPSRYYMGNGLYHNIRYNYRYDTRLSWGISAETDAGEPSFTTTTPRPDYLSGYIQLGDMGMLRQLVVGSYRLRFGQGLVLNSDFSLGKNMLLQGLTKQSASIKPHRGTGESDYYSGAATTFAWDTWQLTAFVSHRFLDATLDGASISTLKTDGYHRTPLEIAKRHNTRANLFGTHIGYSAHGLHMGLTALYQSFNRRFAPPKQDYKRYAPQGNAFTNVSVDYAWFHHRISIAGETAIDGKGAIATLNTLRLRAADQLHLTLLQRHYAHDYWALEGKSFSTSSDIRNEQGIYLGAEWQPHRQLQVTAYVDACHFPYQRYRVSAPSYSTDGMMNINYTVNDKHQLTVRYRYRMKQRDVAEGYLLTDGTLMNEWTHRLRTQWNGEFSQQMSCQMLVESCIMQAETLETGVMTSVQATYSPIWKSHTLRFSIGTTGFKADYSARLYGYERGLLYAYNYQMYSGTGLRGYLLLQYSHKNAPRLSCTAKVGTTYYFDRNTIGSGAAMIDACHREDIQLQVRYTF